MTDQRCTWCFGSGEWVEHRKIVPCNKCDGTGHAPAEVLAQRAENEGWMR